MRRAAEHVVEQPVDFAPEARDRVHVRLEQSRSGFGSPAPGNKVTHSHVVLHEIGLMRTPERADALWFYQARWGDWFDPNMVIQALFFKNRQRAKTPPAVDSASPHRHLA